MTSFLRISKSPGVSLKKESTSDIIKELNTYLNTPLAEESEVINSWWKDNEKYFPLFSKMAKKYLTPPLSSVSSEEVFSQAASQYVLTKKK